MGCLGTVTFLINNPHLKISGVIAASPFWAFGSKISQAQRWIVGALAAVLEELPINGKGSVHFLSHDRAYFIHETFGNPKRSPQFLSGGLLNSMMQSIEDLQENAKLFKYPLMVFIAGQDKIIKNAQTKGWLKRCGTAQKDIRLTTYPNSYHNIHKEPVYKFRQFAEIYEFIYSRLSTEPKPGNFDPQGLKSIRFGRPDKRKSLKVKRGIFSLLILSYLYWGIVILLARALVRFKNSKRQLTLKEMLLTLIVWPKQLYKIYLKASALYYS